MLHGGREPRFADAGLARKENHLTFAGLNAAIAVRVLLFATRGGQAARPCTPPTPPGREDMVLADDGRKKSQKFLISGARLSQTSVLISIDRLKKRPIVVGTVFIVASPDWWAPSARPPRAWGSTMLANNGACVDRRTSFSVLSYRDP